MMPQNGRDVWVAPDGRSVHLVQGGGIPGRVISFTRDPTTGELTPAGCVTEGVHPGCVTALGLRNASGIDGSPDGEHVYVASSGAGALEGDVAAFRVVPVPDLLGVALRAPRRLKPARALRVRVRCLRLACGASVRARVRLVPGEGGRGKKVLRAKPRRRVAAHAPGEARRLTFRLGARAARELARAVRSSPIARRRSRATFTVVATAGDQRRRARLSRPFARR